MPMDVKTMKSLGLTLKTGPKVFTYKETTVFVEDYQWMETEHGQEFVDSELSKSNMRKIALALQAAGIENDYIKSLTN